MAKAKKTPHRLKLLPGLRWKGELVIMSSDKKGYAVQFNATGIDSGQVQYIYDRAVLTVKQLKDWTGWSE
jgi:hypothetical protein